jgi:hypothetical protein
MGLFVKCLKAGVGLMADCGTWGANPPTGSDVSVHPRDVVLQVKREEQHPHTHGPAVSNAETIEYQKRELGKELVLLERHLLQQCKINGKGCGCCQKHPIALQGLAEETLGMTGEPVYAALRDWTREIAPKTTAEASQSGRFDREYVAMAMKARGFRKKILESEDIMELFSPDTRAATSPQAQETLRQVFNQPGEPAMEEAQPS